MGRLPLCAALAACLLLANAQPAARPLTTEEIQDFREDHADLRSYDPVLLTGFERDLRQALSSGTIDQAADALALRHGIGSANMRALTRLWLTVKVRRFRFRGNEAEQARLRRDLRALLPAVRSSPLGLQLAAEALDWLNECDGEDFAALIAGATDPGADAWAVAEAATCSDNYLRAAAVAPDKAMPALIRAAQYGGLDVRETLPLYHWLTRPEQLARIGEVNRPDVSAWLFARYARGLFNAGMTERAIALIDGLPVDLKQRVLAERSSGFAATVDGLSITVPQPRDEEKVGLETAAVYALAGRTAEAEALFATMPRLAAVRRSFDCAWSGRAVEAGTRCERQRYEDSAGQNIDLLLLGHFLHRPADDPYPLAEAGFSGMGGGSTVGSGTAALRCRVFDEARFGDICRNGRRAIGSVLRPVAVRYGRDMAPVRAMIAGLNLPGLAAAQTETEAEMARVLATMPAFEPYGRPPAPAVTPTPPPFAELPLPERYRGTRPEPRAVPAGTADLPAGFMPVRFERSGARAAVISISQSYDPTGEVSQGGYWLHLSEDGGRSWQAPLYTGLAQSFPYVVPATSRLPMLNGDRLDLEVTVEEIDTASITYPPVGLRTRRRAENLYLQIPLADLSRDSDGDGLTDIAARSLLLDRPRGEAATPFIVGSDAGADCAAPAPERAALIALLERLFSGGSGALVEPVDRPAGAPLIAGWRSATASAERPVFIRGDPSDYRCLRANRLMAVYSEADIAALERFRPDFHAVTVPPIIYNRDRDRGYVVYSLGWAGGTFRLRLVNGAWVFDEISNWIS